MRVATLILPPTLQSQQFSATNRVSASTIVSAYPSVSPPPSPPSDLSYEYFQRGNILPGQLQLYWKIHSGIVRTNTWDSEGIFKTVGIWGAGNIIGPGLSVLEPYQMECLSTVKVEPIRHLHDFAEVLIQQQQQTEALLNIILTRQIQQRLVKVFLWLADRFGQDWSNGARIINLRLTHQHLADLAGTTRVTATRLINQLEQTQQIQRLPQYRFVIYPASNHHQP
ncbi:Crp/Fnr family transcriptional regulator [Alkalinema sp. FACHB-956]|uniref:Crp/Fnr family transcriptional regulator n=1 Tax=Alkalinema sp. FACHB-956 TaxID=2692768 RepID=UPI001684C56A|nr:Crp/Fnr family transcriptional regulator [Alkalinema sp. FACHB-956]MBD2327895.1 Crp/Fnr family transcriptional regulator [Alkalinema sp. FACHB-956]